MHISSLVNVILLLRVAAQTFEYLLVSRLSISLCLIVARVLLVFISCAGSQCFDQSFNESSHLV